MFASTYMCIFGKQREEKRVQIVCKKGDCANFVQIKLAPESVQTLCKILACRGAWLACGASRPPPEGHGSIRGLKTTGSASGLFLSLRRFQLLQLFHRRLKILFHRRRFRIFQGAEF